MIVVCVMELFVGFVEVLCRGPEDNGSSFVGRFEDGVG